MKLNVYKDQRFCVAKELLVTILGKKDIENTSAFINEQNDLICVIRETAIISCNLGNVIPGFPIYIDCESTFNLLADDEDNSKYLPILDIRLINQLNEYYRRYITNKSMYQLIFHRDNMEQDEEFSSYLHAKADEGAKFYKGISLYNNHKFMFPVFTGFPKLAKNDTLSLNVYSIDNEHFLIEMDIFKSKIKRNVKLLYRVLNVF